MAKSLAHPEFRFAAVVEGLREVGHRADTADVILAQEFWGGFGHRDHGDAVAQRIEDFSAGTP
jgi:hypothetical protein